MGNHPSVGQFGQAAHFNELPTVEVGGAAFSKLALGVENGQYPF
jgi:hypothetical protein